MTRASLIPSYPRRPSPAKIWLGKQRGQSSAAAAPAATPPPQPVAARASASPNAARDPRRAAAPAALPALPSVAPGTMPILLGETLELALLFSWLPERLYGWLVEQTLPLVARYQPRRQPGGLTAAWGADAAPPDHSQSRLDWLRAALLREVASGLAVVATPLTQLGRPQRNQALIARAETIGRLAWELVRCPGAAILEYELGHLLAHLRR
jgi:hypothetical protein